MTEKKFQIFQRQYDIIIQQAVDNLPHECGGFVGGKNQLITAILPTYNKHLGNTRETFSITSDDILRAHEFFDKHQLSYFGIYHTHPSGVAIPSHQDLKNNQLYLFIIGLSRKEDADFVVWEAHGFHTERLELEVLSDSGMKVADIYSGRPINDFPRNDIVQEAQNLGQMLDDMKHGKHRYQNLGPGPFDSSAFNTIA